MGPCCRFTPLTPFRIHTATSFGAVDTAKSTCVVDAGTYHSAVVLSGDEEEVEREPTAEDRHGGVNNFIDLKTFRSFHEGWRSTQVSDDVFHSII